MPNPFRWCLRRRRRLIALIVGLLVLVNLAAFMHARAFTHYATGGTRTGAVQTIRGWQKLKVLATGVTLPRPENSVTPADYDLPFTTHAIAEGNVTLEAWHIPVDDSRGLILWFHGHGGCKCALLREAMAMRKMGYASLLVDFRGSGGSSEAITTIGALEADDVAAAVGYAREHWPGQRLVLFGQSMGAAAVLRAVAGGVAAEAVVLECPFDRLLTTVEHRFERMGLPAFPLARLLIFWGGVQNGFDAFAHNPVDYAAAVRCPALLMHGEQDPLVRTAEGQAIFAALAGPKRWELFDEAGHESYCFKCRERWLAVVGEFLGEHLR
jgi:alpha-beta hydrolase superfamily lysophospholipase